ncbi:MAG: K+ channel, inward rectifier, partial [Lishizhenia sp.]|nr:K+ channel, inward rectifier [Lishizhenia sp.]
GAMSPENKAIGLVSSLESFIGLSGFALATGLLYGRFSKPKAKLIFSKNALIAPYKEIQGLMIRVANQRDSQLINLKAKLAFSQVQNEKREFFFLPLEMDMINLLASSWTIVHPLDENSPLKNLTLEDVQTKDMEILLFLEGYDETYAQSIHSRTSFKGSEILFNRKFKRILGKSKNGKARVELDQLSSVEEVEKR